MYSVCNALIRACSVMPSTRSSSQVVVHLALDSNIGSWPWLACLWSKMEALLGGRRQCQSVPSELLKAAASPSHKTCGPVRPGLTKSHQRPVVITVMTAGAPL